MMAGNEHETVVRLLGERAGMLIPADRIPAVRDATARAMSRSGFDDLGHYVEALATGRVSIADLLDEVTIGETYFFREPKHFAFLREVALPSIVESRGAGHPLRFWSAACSSGEEAYSLAMLAADLGLAHRTQVVGTDISRDALVRARRATYGKWSMRDRGLALARQHLLHVDDEWRVAPAIRSLVRFARLNLADGDYATLAGPFGLDLVFCRNVLIYLDRDTVARVARGMFAALAPGGFLVLGSSDPAFADLAPFEVVTHDGGLFYRRPDPAAALPAQRPSFALEPSFDPSFDLVASSFSVRLSSSGPHAERAATPLPEASPAPPPAATEATEEPDEVAREYTQALVLGEQGRLDEALVAIRRALYLAPGLVMGHFAQGILMQRRGDVRRARRCFRTVRTLCTRLARDLELPLSDGLTVGYIDASAAIHLGERAAARSER